MRTRVKICGITSPEDAFRATEVGVDAIGLVFYEPSPRYVTIKQAIDIIDEVPAFVNCVGLFVDAEESYVRDVINQVAIDTLQFHGEESESFCKKFKMPYIKAIRMQDDIDLHQESERYSSARALLLDTYVKGQPGGTGQTFEWSKIPDNLAKPVILAGGLDVNNVQSAIRTCKPFAVDVSGGVEISKGKKDYVKMKQFMREINEC